jgi:diacylglycerol kinase (ATP)
MTSDETSEQQAEKSTHGPMRAKLIFNATAGQPQESPQQLASIIEEMQARNIRPEVYIVRPKSRIGAVVRNAIKRGFTLIVVAGGDGTIDIVAGCMVGSTATLGIIPTGTRNNVALSLGIPGKIAEAVALLREGRRLRIDAGHVRSGRNSRWFLEAATIGLLSDLYPIADDIQHGNLAQIGGLLAAFVSATASKMSMVLDRGERLELTAHMALIANMPFVGPNYRLAPDVSYDDGLLDVLVYAEMSKLDLITHAVQVSNGGIEDPRVKHYRVRQITMESDPQMPVLADGALLGRGPVTALVRAHALKVIAGTSPVAEPAQPATTNAQAPAHDQPA